MIGTVAAGSPILAEQNVQEYFPIPADMLPNTELYLKGEIDMMLTQENISDVIFENEDARLLIDDVIKNTSAVIYYYTGVEITVANAIKIWNRAMKADRDILDRTPYSISFINSHESIKKALCG